MTSAPIRTLLLGAMKSSGGGTTDANSEATFEPVLLTTQVVAGINYKVKYQIGNGKYVHANIFEPLPCYADEKPTLSNFEMNKSESDAL